MRIDNRNIPALGRIGDPDDIIASVRVEDGKVRYSLVVLAVIWLVLKQFVLWLFEQILSDTYSPMPSYRLCTSDGVIQLTEGLFERLKEDLMRRMKEEEAESGPAAR